jgi:hypothetical protein
MDIESMPSYYRNKGVIGDSYIPSFKQFFMEACWKNYKQVGMKKKKGKMVPNCVPK